MASRKPLAGIGVFLAIAILWCAFAADASADPLDPAASPAPAATSASTVEPTGAEAPSTASEVQPPPPAQDAVEAVSAPESNVPVASQDTPVEPSATAGTSTPGPAFSNSGELADDVATAADSDLTATGPGSGRALGPINQTLGTVPNAAANAASPSDSGIGEVAGTLGGASGGGADAARGPILEQSGSAVTSNLGAGSGHQSGGHPQDPSPSATAPPPAFPSTAPKLIHHAAPDPGDPAIGLGSQPAASSPVALLPFGAAGHLSFSGDSNTTAPTTPQRMPADGPGDGSGTAGGSSGGFFFFGFAVLLGLLVLAGQAVTRRVRSAAASWRPLAFVSLLERPG